MKLVMKMFLIAGLLISSDVYGITAVEEEFTETKVERNLETKAEPMVVKADSKMLLLSWQGDYLRTTLGTLHVQDVVINNLTGLEQDELGSSVNLAEVMVRRNGDKVVQIDIINAK